MPQPLPDSAAATPSQPQWRRWLHRALHDPQPVRAWLAAGLVCAPVAVAAGWLAADSTAEADVFTTHYMPMAQWLRGERDKALLTYPM